MTGPVLVTGATGFLGGRVARDFAAIGVEVRGLGRNTTRGTALERDGVLFSPVDLADQAALARVCRGVETVVHTAALSTAWASYSEYQRANVYGTAAIIEAAIANRVRRLIHISTPAVLSRFANQFDLTEGEAIPEIHTSQYGASKAAAERLVTAASDLETVIVRPKAIYGPGDTALLPRVVEAAKRGRLRIVGDGETMTDLTHVADVARSIRLIADADQVSGIFHIAGPEPVKLWHLIGELLRRLGLQPPTEMVSVKRAMFAASVLERMFRVLWLRGEPPITRYKVAVVAYSQTLDSSRARRELGFEPHVSLEKGLEDVVAAITGVDEPARPLPHQTRPRAQLSVSLATAGTVHPPAWAVGVRSLRRIVLPVLIGIVHHPVRGVVLFDTGYGSAAPGRGSAGWSMYRRVVGVRSAGLTETLRSRGVDPAQVGAVILSHFDPDHCGGLSEVPNAAVFCSAAAWNDVAGYRTGSWRRRIIPGSLPPDLAARVRLLDLVGETGDLDLFGDGSIIVIPLIGHTPGHLGIRVDDDDGTKYLLCGDAAWTTRRLDGGGRGIASLIARDRHAYGRTHARLHTLRVAEPRLVVVPSHCPDAADKVLVPDWRRAPIQDPGATK